MLAIIIIEIHCHSPAIAILKVPRVLMTLRAGEFRLHEDHC